MFTPPITERKIEKVDPLPDPVEKIHIQPSIPTDDRSLSTKKYLESLGDHVPLPSTPFITGLWLELKRTRGVPNMINDMGSVIRGTKVAAKERGFHTLKIEEIRKKHIMLILEKCAQVNPKWSYNRHNVYKAYLRKIFKPLVTLESIEMNPVADIEMDSLTDLEQLSKTDNTREVLTPEERKRVDDLRKNRYAFWKVTQIFFNSGAWETELMRVRESDVDLIKQQYKVLIKKRKKYTWEPKAIKDIVVPLWQEALDYCKKLRLKDPSDQDIYLFGRLLLPGYRSIRPNQIGRRWAKYVMSEKKGLGIKKKFYDLKHLHTTEMMDILTTDGKSIEGAEKAVAQHNSHTTTAMVKNVYDVGNKGRKNDRIRKAENKFAWLYFHVIGCQVVTKSFSSFSGIFSRRNDYLS